MYEIKNFLNGNFKKGSGEKKGIFSPINGLKLGHYYESNRDDLEREIKNISKAQKDWGKLTLRKRSEVFYKYRQIVLKNIEKLAKINSNENGKTIIEAKGGINKALEIIEFACSMPNSIKTRISKVSTGINAYEEKRPLGIVASISPFNFPSMVPHWTVPVAIMSGNAIILKPSELTPISAFQMAKMFEEAGLPKGIFNIVNGGKDIVESITEIKEIKAVTFVGSSDVAKIVYERSSKNYKRVLALGEAKNHIVVTPDTNPKIVAKNIIASAFGMSGQRCMAASVILSVGKNHFKREMIEMLSKVVPNKDYGAIITKANLEKITNYIEYAEKNGGEILVDGRKIKKPFPNGNWIGPTVIDWKNQKNKMSPKEIFGPVLELVHTKTVEEAIEIQNKSPYGNGASIFTQNGKYAEIAIDNFQAGMIGVNIGVPVPREPFSFGGIKQSLFGSGNITGNLLLDFMTNTIKVTQKWNEETKKEDWMS